MYPIADGNTDSESYRENAAAKPLNRPMMAWFLDHYLRTPADAAQSEAEEAWEQFESNGSGDPIAEERRLFYVGITRARHRLTLSGCATRRQRDNVSARQPSRFLKEIPPELVEQRNAGKGVTSLSPEESKELRTNFFAQMKAKLANG